MSLFISILYVSCGRGFIFFILYVASIVQVQTKKSLCTATREKVDLNKKRVNLIKSIYKKCTRSSITMEKVLVSESNITLRKKGKSSWAGIT